MSRWRQDPDGAAAEILRRSLDALALSGRVLLANAGEAAAQVLRADGLDVTHWSRRAGDIAAPTPWPSGGPYACALLRLAKSKDEQEMALHAVASVLEPGGRVLLFGGNDEGIRSAINTLEAMSGPVETLATRGHGRIVQAARPAGSLKTSLAAWRREMAIDIAGRKRTWVTYPGLFSSSTLDEGTALMLSALPDLRRVARVLDYGCGSGPIAAAMRERLPEAQIDMLDADTVALLAAQENVAGARAVLGTSLTATGSQRYDAILSNPPLHAGVGEDHSALERLIAQAPKHLKAGGMLQMVVQRRLALAEPLKALFSEVTVAAENGRFRVWRALSR